jgi:hypothetical protein
MTTKVTKIPSVSLLSLEGEEGGDGLWSLLLRVVLVTQTTYENEKETDSK